MKLRSKKADAKIDRKMNRYIFSCRYKVFTINFLSQVIFIPALFTDILSRFDFKICPTHSILFRRELQLNHDVIKNRLAVHI